MDGEPTITKDEFARQYAERNGLSAETIQQRRWMVTRCLCDEGMCEGWAMMPSEIVLEDRHTRGDGTMYPEG